MINIKRPKSKAHQLVLNASEHFFEIAAGLFVVLIVGLGLYIFNKTGTKNNIAQSNQPAVAGVSTSRVEANSDNLVNKIAQGANHKYFFDALTKTGIYKDLEGTTAYTVLVPDDNAFQNLGQEQLDQLFADKAKLTDLVKNHIISGTLKQLDFPRVTAMRAISGKFISFKQDDFGTMFNSAKLMSSAAEASNGVAYEINAIIF